MIYLQQVMAQFDCLFFNAGIGTGHRVRVLRSFLFIVSISPHSAPHAEFVTNRRHATFTHTHTHTKFTSLHQTMSSSINQQVLAAFYEGSKGGAVVTCGNKLMVALEFMGPVGNNGGVEADMVYADKNPMCQAVWQQRGCTPRDLGAAFLMGETIEFIETNDEGDFKNLLKKYQQDARTEGLIDIKSGLKLYNTKILP
jgi:hypothetical protein